MLLIPVWSYFLYGYYFGQLLLPVQKHTFILSLPLLRYPVQIMYGLNIHALLFLFAFSLLVGGIYILNQIADIETDRKNPGFPLLAREIVSKRTAIIETVILFLCSLTFAFFIEGRSLVLFVPALVLGYTYSMPPFRWSGKPVLDFISNAAGYGCLTFFLGWMASGNQQWEKMFLHALPYCLLMVAGSIASTIPDMPGDAMEHKMTTSLWLGIRKSSIIAAVALAGAATAGFLLHDLFAVSTALLALLLCIRLLFAPERKNAYPVYQLGGGLVALIPLLFCPPILAVAALTVIGTKIYFWKMHGTVYPRMGQ
jgi:chlorophyll synthase